MCYTIPFVKCVGWVTLFTAEMAGRG